MEDNIFFELLDNPYLKNDSVISARFIGNLDLQNIDSLEDDKLSLREIMFRQNPEETLKKNINLLEGGISLKDEYWDKFKYLEISIKNAWKFSYDSIDKNYSDKFYVDIDESGLARLFIKTQEGLYDGFSRLVPVKTIGNDQLSESINECEIDYREYKHLLQIYWYTMYSKFNINICVPPPIHWKKNDKRFGYNGEFFKINLDITVVILFINLLKIFPFKLAKILTLIFSVMELNLFSDFEKQIEILSTDKRQLDTVKTSFFEWSRRNRVYFEFEKMKFEYEDGQIQEFDNLYGFYLTVKGFNKFAEYKNFLIDGPFDYPLKTDRTFAQVTAALFGEKPVFFPEALWVEFNEDYLSIKNILK